MLVLSIPSARALSGGGGGSHIGGGGDVRRRHSQRAERLLMNTFSGFEAVMRGGSCTRLGSLPKNSPLFSLATILGVKSTYSRLRLEWSETHAPNCISVSPGNGTSGPATPGAVITFNYSACPVRLSTIDLARMIFFAVQGPNANWNEFFQVANVLNQCARDAGIPPYVPEIIATAPPLVPAALTPATFASARALLLRALSDLRGMLSCRWNGSSRSRLARAPLLDLRR